MPIFLRLLLPFLFIFLDIFLISKGRIKAHLYIIIDIAGSLIWCMILTLILTVTSSVGVEEELLGTFSTILISENDDLINIPLTNKDEFNYTDEQLNNIGAVDLDKIDFNKVNLDSTDFKAGTDLVRYQIYLITKEICDRPEIKISQAELLGMLYIEDYDNIKNATDIVKNVWPGTNNSSNCGGPFQISDSLLYNETETYPEAVRVYVSKLENPELSDNLRVMTRSEASQYKDRFKFNTNGRPDKFYFSDAAYTAAYRLTKNSEGYHYGAKPENIYRIFKEPFNNIESTNLTSDQKFDLKLVTSMQNYSGIRTECCLGWNLDLYKNILSTFNNLDYKWELAYSKRNLNKTLFNDTNTVTKGDGSLVDTLTPTIANLTNYVDKWNEFPRNSSNHFPSHIYSFIAFNGGTWMLKGLEKMVSQMTIKEDTKLEAEENSKPLTNLKQDKAGRIYTNAVSTGDVGSYTGNSPDGEYSAYTLTNGIKYICPIPKSVYTVTSKAGLRNIGGKQEYHNGIDLAIASNDGGYGYPIVSTRYGTVVQCQFNYSSEYGSNAGGGLYIKIKHSDGTFAVYMHLSRTVVSVGDIVQEGQKIGEIGNTGYCLPARTDDKPFNGTHLHFELRNSSNQATNETRALTNTICNNTN